MVTDQSGLPCKQDAIYRFLKSQGITSSFFEEVNLSCFAGSWTDDWRLEESAKTDGITGTRAQLVAVQIFYLFLLQWNVQNCDCLCSRHWPFPFLQGHFTEAPATILYPDWMSKS